MNNLRDTLNGACLNPKELTVSDIFDVLPPGSLIPALRDKNVHYTLNERIPKKKAKPAIILTPNNTAKPVILLLEDIQFVLVYFDYIDSKKKPSGQVWDLFMNYSETYFGKRKVFSPSESCIYALCRELRTELNYLLYNSKSTSDYIANEGHRRIITHSVIERDSKFVRIVKQRHKEQFGHLFCTICTFNKESILNFGEAAIEAHHLVPLNKIDLDKPEMNSTENLAIVCTNCHRRIHRFMVENEIPDHLSGNDLFTHIKNRISPSQIRIRRDGNNQNK